jgi:hypothetical protein
MDLSLDVGLLRAALLRPQVPLVAPPLGLPHGGLAWLGDWRCVLRGAAFLRVGGLCLGRWLLALRLSADAGPVGEMGSVLWTSPPPYRR